jgi:hypothetical protein
MAKKKKQEAQVEQEVTKVDLTKLKTAAIEDDVVKVDLSKPPTPKEDEIKEDNADNSGVVASAENADATQEQEEVQPEAEAQEAPVVEEITEEEATEALEEAVEKTAEVVSEAIDEQEQTGRPMPDNIQKVVDFIEETGGDLEDYVKLNQDYDKMDQDTLLKEYYKQTKPHLTEDEVAFSLEDAFSYDVDVDDEREVKKKKIALKEQVASAKSHLDGLKSKYFAEIKGGSKLTQNQQEALNFYEEYQEEEKSNQKFAEEAKSTFLNRTNKFFGDQFKGFEYKVADKKFRFNVNNGEELRDTQSDINNFIGKFLDEDSKMKDAPGYHKALFTAMNPDAVAKHFYEQGKADAIKETVATSKNINMAPRQAFGEVKDSGGFKARVLTDDTSPTFKFKK